MFKAIVYTNKNDKLTSTVVEAAAWDKKYIQLFAKGINYDQAVFLHQREYATQEEAKIAADTVITALRKGLS